jgi:hypothetical protein
MIRGNTFGYPVTGFTDVDLGACRGRVFDQLAAGWVIVLPGAMYLPDAPLLWYTREAALAAGWNVLAVWDTYDGTGDARAWVEERAMSALAYVGNGARPVLAAKSITTLAAPIAAQLGLPAAWLTPLIAAGKRGEPSAAVTETVIRGLRAATAPSLLVGGTADALWDGALARSIPAGEVVEIPGGDHVLQIPGAPEQSIDALRIVTEAIARFLADLERPLTGSSRSR